jgi:hypothetical protein
MSKRPFGRIHGILALGKRPDGLGGRSNVTTGERARPFGGGFLNMPFPTEKI